MNDIKKTLIISATIIIAVIIFAKTFYNRAKADDIINVTGLGQVDFESDLITWDASYVQKDFNLEKAYSKIKNNQIIIREYLKKNSVNDKEVSFSSIDIQKEFKEEHNIEGKLIKREFDGFVLTQTVKIESTEIDKIENISRNITELINEGIELYSNSPNYFYTKLSSLKIQLIASAAKDAKERAEQVSENAGSVIGKIRNSNIGVFQILERNSSEEMSWQGAYNKNSRYKTAMVTVRVQYQLE
ncbi:MAG TPA: SIMPL domain-containing protein [bacterium]|nr:SIMPL domain-containing protein [bacterium]HPN31048.1 SIMPL domain-containing protein [bacterium]